MTMNAHSCIDSMWMSALGELLHHGARSPSRQGSTIEVIGWCETLEDPQRNFLLNERRAIDPCYACAELLWYLSRSDDTAMIEAYAPQYEQFAEPGGTYHRAHGAYGKRIATNVRGGITGEGVDYIDQLEIAVERLQQVPEDRQVVVTLWRPNDLLASNVRDKPCTIAFQYKISGGKLHASTAMRSNDIWLGFPYDVFAFSCLQMLVAASVGVPVGPYHHHVIGSLHLYSKNEVAAREAYKEGLGKMRNDMRHGWHDQCKLENAYHYVELEGLQRLQQEAAHVVVDGGTVLSDAVRTCAKRFNDKWYNPLSPLLQKGLENYANHRGQRLRGQDNAREGASEAAE